MTHDTAAVMRRYRMPWARMAAVFYVLIAAAQALIGHEVLAGLFVATAGLWLAAPPTELTSTGVRLPTIRPWRRSVPFTDVTAVLKPSALSRGRWLRLQLRGGEVVTLTYVAVERAAAVAQLAGVEVKAEPFLPTPQPPRAYAGPVREDSDRPLSDIELARRFAALQRRAAQLSAQLRSPTEKG